MCARVCVCACVCVCVRVGVLESWGTTDAMEQNLIRALFLMAGAGVKEKSVF